MDLGTDMALDDNFDLVFGEEDIGTVSQGRCVAQDLRKTLFQRLFIIIQNEDSRAEELKTIIETAVTEENRIDFDSLKIDVVFRQNQFVFQIRFTCVEGKNPETLVFTQEDIIRQEIL